MDLGLDKGQVLVLVHWCSLGGLCGYLFLLSLLRTKQGPVSGLSPGATLVSKGCIAFGAMQIWVACTDTWVHGDILAQAAEKDQVWVCSPVMSGVLVDVPGPCGHQGYSDAQGLGCIL